MKKFIKDNWKSIIGITLMSSSVILILLDIVKIFKIPEFFQTYIVIAPLIGVIICRSFSWKRNDSWMIKTVTCSLGVSAAGFLALDLLRMTSVNTSIKIFVYMITILFFIFYGCSVQTQKIDNKNIVKTKSNEKKIFSLYYINTDKVYEIAMLLNNKVITNGVNENESEIESDEQTSFGITTNLSYLESVKGELGATKNTQNHSSKKNKVIENFDVKTTKSNMLAAILARGKEYSEKVQLQIGDLVLLKNATLTLINEEDSYAVTKMILNGAFKDTKISTNSDDVKFEMDLSAMINSLLKDCVYELECEVNNKKFALTIPMTFENDFENSYNIYDIQVGKVTIVGIYRGKRQYRKRLSLQEIFQENNTSKKGYEDKQLRLEPSSDFDNHDMHQQKEKSKNVTENSEVIDVIAIIQEINAK